MRFRLWAAAAVTLAVAAVSASAATYGALPSRFTAHQTAPARPAASAAAADETQFTQPNTRAQTGYLENGMRYGVMTRRGTNSVTVMFHVFAGSAHENENERGIAHYLEHMSVNGSRNFPADTMIPQLAAMGIAFGRDQNASTGFTGTTYRLDISEATPEKLDIAFRWMRDIADGLTISQDQVDAERGVILSEYNDSRDPLREISVQMLRFLGPGLRVAQREPIGTRESINSIDSRSLRAFWQRWYRPENSAIIVVGDGTHAEFLQRIQTTFGDWRNATPRPAPTNMGRLDPRRPSDFLSVNAANAPTIVQVCRGHDTRPRTREGVVTRTRDFEEVIWTGVLQERLGHLVQSANPPFVQASVGTDDTLESATFACATVTPRAGDWQAAVRAVATEMRRMEIHGITQQEFDSQVHQIRASLDDGVNSTDTMPAPALADAILYNFTHTGTFSEAAEDRRIGTMALQRITRQSVKAEFDRVWTRAGQPLVMVVSNTDIDRNTMRQVWTQAVGGPAPSAPRDVATRAWAYESFGAPGRLISREVIGSPNFVRMEFENGVRLNFKQTRNAADRVEIRIRFGAGDQELAAADVPVARVAAGVFALMGTGRNSIEDISRVCQGRLCDIRLVVDRDAFTLRSTTRAADLDLDLQLLTAYLTDPGFRPEVDARMPTEAENLFRVGRTDPAFVAALAREAAMAQPRAAIYPTQEQMAAMRVADFRRVLQPILTRDALEVTIIGDVSEQRAVQAMAATLGAIPRRERVDRRRADAPPSRFPNPMPSPMQLTHEGPPDRALVSYTWPLFVWTPERSREAKVIDLLTLLYSNELTTGLRERLGAAYSPRATSRLERGGDDGAFFVEITTNPGQAEQVHAEIRRIAARFAAGDFTQEDLDRARRPLLDFGATRQLGNEWWVETINGSWQHPDQLIIANRWNDYSAITLDEVKQAARRYLSRDPMVITVLPRTR